MTDEERIKAIEEFLNFAEREGWTLRRRVIGGSEPASDKELSWLIEEYLVRRIPS